MAAPSVLRVAAADRPVRWRRKMASFSSSTHANVCRHQALNCAAWCSPLCLSTRPAAAMRASTACWWTCCRCCYPTGLPMATKPLLSTMLCRPPAATSSTAAGQVLLTCPHREHDIETICSIMGPACTSRLMSHWRSDLKVGKDCWILHHGVSCGTGIMGELTHDRADIASFPLSLTLPRPTYVGLSYSYLNGGIGILVRHFICDIPFVLS